MAARKLNLLTAAAAAGLLLTARPTSAQYTATYTPETAPPTTEEGQTGTNACGTGSSQSSTCQNAYINSATDFCLWAPPDTTSPYGTSSIGNTERLEVAWCTNPGRGTRVIPSGTISSVQFLQTDRYIQISGTMDGTKLNIPSGDDGGELDPHGADGNGNPIGGLVFTSAFAGELEQVHEWTSFMSTNYFCFRACIGDQAAEYCEHIYDTLGCGWNMPQGQFDGFSQCEADVVEPMGVYGTSTFHQGDPTTPAAHPPGATSNCQTFATVGGGLTGAAAAVRTSSSASAAGPSSLASASSASSSSASASSSAASSSASTSANSSGSSSSSALSSSSSSSSTAAASSSMSTSARSSSAPSAVNSASAAAQSSQPASGASGRTQHASVAVALAVVLGGSAAIGALLL